MQKLALAILAKTKGFLLQIDFSFCFDKGIYFI
jgi:hypothetical protein